MWTSLVVPVDVGRNLSSDGFLTQRNENTPGAFVFDGPHQSFNNSDTSVLAISAKALFDIPWFRAAPRSEICRDKLTSLVGNEMSGRTSDRTDGLGHERNNGIRSWLFLENSKSNGRSRELVNRKDDPPAERPNLSQAEWCPRYPGACCGEGCHFNVPNVIEVSCGDNSVFLFCFGDFGIGLVGERFFLHDTTDGGGAKIQSCSGQYLSDSHLPHGWAKCFEPLDDIPDMVRIFVHRLGKLVKPILGIGCSRHPVGNCFGFNHESPGGFCQLPGAGGLDFQDGHTFLRGILRTPPWRKFGHSRDLDSNLFPEQSDFVFDAVECSGETKPFDAPVDSETPGEGDSSMGQGNAKDDCYFDVLRPILGRGNALKRAQVAHTMFSETAWKHYELNVA